MGKIIHVGREQLKTCGIPAKGIPGRFTCDSHSLEEVKNEMAKMTKDFYSLEEVYGAYCQLAEFIHCPVELAFEYAANMYSLEEWSYSLRDLNYLGGGLYKGREALGHDTSIYIRLDAYPENGVVDYFCAWDQGDELWMRYYFRFIDAMPVIRKPGTIVLWTNCKHPYYDRSQKDIPEYIEKMRNRTDRDWVGDFWLQFYAIHKIEVTNLKRILEYRYQHALSLDQKLKCAS